MSYDYQQSIDAVNRSKICARNYADREVPEEVIQHLLDVAIGGPYKQGRRYLDVYALTNKEKVKEIWKHRWRPDEENSLAAEPKVNKDGTPTTFVGNAQVMAPVLFLFVLPEQPTPDYPDEEHWDPTEEEKRSEERQNEGFAVGSTMGMLVLEANRLGLHTGNCACFDFGPVTDLLRSWSPETMGDARECILMVGVGYPEVDWANKDVWVNKGTDRDPEYPENPIWQMRQHPLIATGDVYPPPEPHQRDDPKKYRVY